MVGCEWYWKKAGGVDELGMLEMNCTPNSIPSAYIGTRAQSPLTPGRLAGRVQRRTIHACRRTSRELHEGVWGKSGLLLTLTILCWENQRCKTTVNCTKVCEPKCPGSGLPGLWEGITPRPDLGSQRGLNRSCSPRRDLSNGVSHSRIGHRKRVDSRLLVVGSQTAGLTPGPSFAHNLGCRCPIRQCEGILDIYVSRPF